jgi:hypothetical protein
MGCVEPDEALFKTGIIEFASLLSSPISEFLALKLHEGLEVTDSQSLSCLGHIGQPIQVHPTYGFFLSSDAFREASLPPDGPPLTTEDVSLPAGHALFSVGDSPLPAGDALP